ncbi:MAG: M56 family metallopeptidase [Dyadobacter sp.]|uniref:M56 family metallopeptidase n=1 Tax=Dyadobacter sp. TaxID=1914288 RepID=UPI003265E7D2
MKLLLYAGEVSLYWIMLYACYWLMLRSHTFFKWNRYYLVGSLFAAFALPFVIYPETAPQLPAIYGINAEAFTVSGSEPEQSDTLSWIQAIGIIYGIGLIIAIYKLTLNFVQLKSYLSAGELIELDDCKVVIMDSNHIGSFSFLQWIVINRNDYENHFDAILRHEMVHTRQLHSIDILLIELFKTIFWFNPVLLLYKHSLQEVHEYLADAQAPNREYYAKFLVAYALNAPTVSVTNHFFNPSQIKNRIQMIYKNRTSKWLLSTYVFSVAMIGTAAILIAGCEGKEYNELTFEKKVLTKEDLANKPIFTVVEEQPEFPGGIQEMYKFLGENIKYPEKATRANVSGRVFLSFVVTEDGAIGDIQVLKGLGFDCDEEAVRVLSKFPKWTPGKQNGIPVNVRYNLPINFQLEESDKTSAAKPDANIELRNTTSLNKPLIIVNGVVATDHDIVKKLDPNSIKSVSVHKDQDALDAYGEKGKNGVISIITNKI